MNWTCDSGRRVCRRWLGAMALAAVAVGCGRATPTTPAVDAPVYSSVDELKQRLSEVAQNGDGGSSLMGLSESVEKIRATEPKKADALAKGVTQLENAGTPGQRKAIAAKMLKDL